MPLTGNLYTVTSSATTTIVQPTVDAQEILVRNMMPEGADNFFRDGWAFSAHSDFTLANNSSTGFSFTTGEYGAQFTGYTIASSVENITANLLEGATIVTGATVSSFNLNRVSPNVSGALLQTATSITGGTSISSESIYASNQASSTMKSSKIISLAPDTQYAMQFTNAGSQSTKIHFELIWAERFNGYTTAWINGAEGVGFPLRAGEDMRLNLIASQAVTAISGGADIEVAVMRQD